MEDAPSGRSSFGTLSDFPFSSWSSTGSITAIQTHKGDDVGVRTKNSYNNATAVTAPATDYDDDDDDDGSDDDSIQFHFICIAHDCHKAALQRALA